MDLPLQLVHEVPGRMRIRCAGLRENPGWVDILQVLTRDLPGLAGVSIRPPSESVVLHYSLEDTSPDAFLNALRSRAAWLAARPPQSAVDGTIGVQMTRRARYLWSRADRTIYATSHGKLDLRTSVPWVLLFLALRQIALNSQLPALPWYTALYYSVQAILRTPERVQSEEVLASE